MKVMAWNLENFKLEPDWAKPFKTPFLLRTLYPDGSPVPMVDVLGVIEVYNRAGGGPPGGPLRAASVGAQGCIQLLQELQAYNDDDTEWRLVVPLSLGHGRRDEAVGVFYNARAVTFEGPDVWDDKNEEALPPGRAEQRGPYPEPWTDRCSQAPDYFAPRVRFYTDDDCQMEITFPDESHRRPCMTRFRENGGNQRVVDLFFFHTSPPLRQDPDGPQNPAFLGCNYLGQVRELYPQGHSTIVLGDFNVDANNANRWNNALGSALARGYRAMLPATIAGDTAVPTMQKERLGQGLTVPPDPIPFPECDRYYYRQYAIDNALYRPQNHAPGAALDLTRGTVVGNAAWPSVMQETIGEINGWMDGAEQWVKFTSIVNWYQNRLRSDHLPLVIEV